METFFELTQENNLGLIGGGLSETGKIERDQVKLYNNLIDFKYSDNSATLFQRTTGMGGSHKGSGEYIDGSYIEKMYIPLQFWFCKDPGLALPLIALQYHEVKLTLDHNMNSIFNSYIQINSSNKTNELWI